MLIVNVKGGLGNQISQYAFYRLLKYRYPGAEVKLSTVDFENHLYKNCFLLEDVFDAAQLDIVYATEQDVRRITKQFPRHAHRREYTKRLWNKAVRLAAKLTGYRLAYVQHLESGYPTDVWWDEVDQKVRKGKSCYFDGYWHSYDYSSILPELRKVLQFKPINQTKNDLVLDEINQCCSVSVHYRQGDYIRCGFDVVTNTYYRNAIQLILEKLKGEKPTFFVFSDEPEKAAKMFEKVGEDVSYQVVDVNSADASYYDIALMKACRHNIIANSTFSYWAAMLNTNTEKIVIRPRMQTQTRKTWSVPGWYILDN